MTLVRNTFLALVLFAAPALLGCFLLPGAGGPGAWFTLDNPDEYPAAACAECHQEAYDQWNRSPHASAYTSPHFKEVTLDHRIEACISCHAPETLTTEGEVVLRDYYPQEGVTCVACHFADSGEGFKDGRVQCAGNFSRQSNFIKSSELCGKCHQDTYEEWNRLPDENRRSCASCHMPPESGTRTVAAETPRGRTTLFSAFEKETKRVSSHSFLFTREKEFKNTMRLRVKGVARSKDSVVVTATVENVLAAHRIPSGGFAYRNVEVFVRLIGEREETLPEPGRFHFTVERDNGVAYREVREVRIVAADPKGRAREVDIVLRKLSAVDDPNPLIYASTRTAVPPKETSEAGKDNAR